jgi:hypothetical protein
LNPLSRERQRFSRFVQLVTIGHQTRKILEDPEFFQNAIRASIKPAFRDRKGSEKFNGSFAHSAEYPMDSELEKNNYQSQRFLPELLLKVVVVALGPLQHSAVPRSARRPHQAVAADLLPASANRPPQTAVRNRGIAVVNLDGRRVARRAQTRARF